MGGIEKVETKLNVSIISTNILGDVMKKNANSTRILTALFAAFFFLLVADKLSFSGQ